MPLLQQGNACKGIRTDTMLGLAWFEKICFLSFLLYVSIFGGKRVETLALELDPLLHSFEPDGT
eukprot:9864760-Karenia_brevis.AAC.1